MKQAKVKGVISKLLVFIIQDISFITAPSTAALLHMKAAYARTYVTPAVLRSVVNESHCITE
jgi:hypothetical protein